MRVVFCGFGNPDNRGCEAIIRTTTGMMNEVDRNAEQIVLCNDYDKVSVLKLPSITDYVKSYYPHAGIEAYIDAGVRRIFGNTDKLCYANNRKSYKKIGNVDLCVSVGGDNFCYSNRVEHFLVHHKHFKENGAKLVHWGSSFERALLNDRLINDLNQFDAIMVRESLSYKNLIAAGIKPRVFTIPDPAFVMEPVEPKDFHDFQNPCVGINVSPLVLSKESKKGLLRLNCINLINYITESGYDVALIPHVADRETGEGDYSVMKELMNHVDHPEKCILIGYKYSAPEIKYIISKCTIFIGARTHATIAAYSSCVPTFVIGYSIKARGIARDLFDGEENYVIPVQSLTREDQLLNAFIWMDANKEKIRKHLNEIMPQYIKRAEDAKEIIRDILKCN